MNKSNDKIPKDELFLAKLIQNAASRGLRSCRSVPFCDDSGLLVPQEKATACCAWGAAALENDTGRMVSRAFGLMVGNDCESTWSADPGRIGLLDAESAGWGFRQALADDRSPEAIAKAFREAFKA